MVNSLVDHSTEVTEALAKVRVNARDFDLFIEFYSIKIVLQSAATLIPSQWFRGHFDNKLAKLNLSCLFIDQSRALKEATISQKETFKELVEKCKSVPHMVLSSLLLTHGPCLFLSVLCLRGFINNAALDLFESSLKIHYNISLMTELDLRKADCSFFGFDQWNHDFAMLNVRRRSRKNTEAVWPDYCLFKVAGIYKADSQSVLQDLALCYAEEQTMLDFLPFGVGVPTFPSTQLLSAVPVAPTVPRSDFGTFGSMFKSSVYLTDQSKLLPKTFKSDSPIICSELLAYNLRPDGPGGVKAFLEFDKSTSCEGLLERYIQEISVAAYAAKFGYGILLEGSNPGRVVINTIKPSSTKAYAKVFASLISFLVFEGILKLSNEAPKEYEDHEAIHKALLILSTNENPTVMIKALQHLSLQFENAHSTVICEKTGTTFSFLLSAMINILKRVWLYEKDRTIEADNLAGGQGETFFPDPSLTPAQAKRQELIRTGAMQDSRSMLVLFTLRAYFNQYIGQSAIEYDCIIDQRKLEREHKLEMVVSGIQITGDVVLEIIQQMMLKCNTIAHSLFDGIGVDFKRFLEAGNVIEAVDGSSNKCACLSYRTCEGTAVSNELINEMLTSMLEKLNDRSAAQFETDYYNLLNWLQAVLGLVSPNRATEFGRVVFTDLAGGSVRKIRFQGNNRSEFGEPLCFVYRKKLKFTKGDLPRNCLTPIPFCLVRLVLSVIVTRHSFVTWLQKRRNCTLESLMHLSTHLFVSEKGTDISNDDKFGSTNFNKKVEIVIRDINEVRKKSDSEVLLESNEMDLSDDAIECFKQGCYRHFCQSAIDLLFKKKESKQPGSTESFEVTNEVIFGHSVQTAKTYNNRGFFANSTLPTLNYNDADLILSVYMSFWSLIGLEEQKEYLRDISRKSTLKDIFGIPSSSSSNAVNSTITTFCKKNISFLKQCVKRFDDGIEWRPEILKAVVHTLAIDGNLVKSSVRNVGLWLPVGSGKTIVPFFTALINQHFLKKDMKDMVLVILPDNAVLVDMVKRAIDAGLNVWEYHTSSKRSFQQNISEGRTPSIVFVVLDTFVESRDIFIKVKKSKKLKRIYFDESHFLAGDRPWKNTALSKLFKILCDDMKGVNYTFMSGTMPKDLQTCLFTDIDVNAKEVASIFPKHSTPLKMEFDYKWFPHEDELGSKIIETCYDIKNRNGAIIVFCMSIAKCNEFKEQLLAKHGIMSVVNSSETRSSDPEWQDSMVSFLSDKVDRLKVCFSTMPVSGLSPAKVNNVIVCGAFSPISLLQALGRGGRDGSSCVSEFWMAPEIEKQMNSQKDNQAKETLYNDLPSAAKAEGSLEFFFSCQNNMCLRRELALCTALKEEKTCLELKPEGAALCSSCQKEENDTENAVIDAPVNTVQEVPLPSPTLTVSPVRLGLGVSRIRESDSLNSQELARNFAGKPKTTDNVSDDPVSSQHDLNKTLDDIFKRVLEKSKTKYINNLCAFCSERIGVCKGNSWCINFSSWQNERCYKCHRRGHRGKDCKIKNNHAAAICTLCYHPGCQNKLQIKGMDNTHLCPAIGIISPFEQMKCGDRHSGIFYAIAHKKSDYDDFKRYLENVAPDVALPNFNDNTIDARDSAKMNPVVEFMFQFIDDRSPFVFGYHLAFDFWWSRNREPATQTPNTALTATTGSILRRTSLSAQYGMMTPGPATRLHVITTPAAATPAIAPVAQVANPLPPITRPGPGGQLVTPVGLPPVLPPVTGQGRNEQTVTPLGLPHITRQPFIPIANPYSKK